MCRSTALLVPVLILGLARGVLHDLPIVHSDYSPMVTRVQIGTPPQYVLMRVSFADVESHLFTPSDCPPFVVCFHPRSSTSYGVLELPAGGEDGVVVLDGSRRVDTLNILGSSQFEFTSSPVLGSDCLVSRDVAGRLGMGFGSQLTRQSSIEIKVQLPIRQKTTQAVPQWSVVLGKTPSFKWPDRKVITVPVHEQQGAWRVSAAITIGGDKLFDHFAPQLVLMVSLPTSLSWEALGSASTRIGIGSSEFSQRLLSTRACRMATLSSQKERTISAPRASYSQTKSIHGYSDYRCLHRLSRWYLSIALGVYNCAASGDTPNALLASSHSRPRHLSPSIASLNSVLLW